MSKERILLQGKINTTDYVITTEDGNTYNVSSYSMLLIENGHIQNGNNVVFMDTDDYDEFKYADPKRENKWCVIKCSCCGNY